MEDMTEEEIEAYKEQVTTTLNMPNKDDKQGLDSILSEKGELKSLGEDTGELSASDADIREQLFEITGEEGVLPGEKVQVGMSLTDSSFAGNEVSEATANFSFNDAEEKPLPRSNDDDASASTSKARKPARRRATRQSKEKPKETQTDECGACGAELPAGATECGVCGAKFS